MLFGAIRLIFVTRYMLLKTNLSQIKKMYWPSSLTPGTKPSKSLRGTPGNIHDRSEAASFRIWPLQASCRSRASCEYRCPVSCYLPFPRSLPSISNVRSLLSRLAKPPYHLSWFFWSWRSIEWPQRSLRQLARRQKIHSTFYTSAPETNSWN